jgi:hypothetical protein
LGPLKARLTLYIFSFNLKKFIINILIFASIILLGLYFLDWYFTSTFKEGKTNKTQWLEGKSNNHYDVAIIGSSRAWWNIDMGEINTKLDLNGINIANNHFSYSEMHLRLKRMYENGNSIKKLFVQTEYWESFSDSAELSTTSYNYLPYLDDSTTYNHLKNKSSEWILYKHFPFWRYAEYNFQWGPEEFLITKMNMRNSIFDSTGTFFTNDEFYGSDSWNPTEPDTNAINKDFDDFLSFCQEKSIEVHVFTAPIYHATINLKLQKDFEQILKSRNYYYDNYINLYSDSSYFNDNTHLSRKGGKFFTKTLMEKVSLIE